jgi:hypothetical protein
MFIMVMFVGLQYLASIHANDSLEAVQVRAEQDG